MGYNFVTIRGGGVVSMCARMGTRTVGLVIVRLHHWWASELHAQGPTKPPKLIAVAYPRQGRIVNVPWRCDYAALQKEKKDSKRWKYLTRITGTHLTLP